MNGQEQGSLPLVHVAMATFNGRRWIEQQVRSILDQEGVRVHLVISDDGSTDGTVEWVRELAESDSRVTLLPGRGGKPGLAQNFFNALANLHVAEGEFAAFTDQDDVWRPGKLARQIRLMRDTGAEGISSNVLAFTVTETEGVKKRLISKDEPQTKWDFIFEAPGPGSTFLLSYEAWKLVADQYQRFGVDGVWLHDWYVYALVRAAGMTWYIDPEPQVAYRQHERNALGEHHGRAAITARFKNLRSGRYREQFVRVARDSARVARERDVDPEWQRELAEFTRLLEDTSIMARAKMLLSFRDIRRSRFEGIALGGACLLGVW